MRWHVKNRGSGSVGWWAVAWLATAGLALAQTEIKVNTDRVNLRAKASLEAEAVGQVAAGDRLEARTLNADWAEVVPPDSIDLWVHREFIKDRTVTVKKLYVRAGPGINYTVVGTLEQGATITPRGEFGEWIRIQPPSGVSLWISRQYVDLVTPEKKEPPPPDLTSPAVAAEPPPAAPPPVVVMTPPARPVPIETPQEKLVPPPRDLVLVPLQGQGRSVEREGELRLSGFSFGRLPSRFRLVRFQGGQLQPVCYVRGNDNQLRTLLGRRMLIRGREYWVQNSRYPVIVPEQIVPRADPTPAQP